MIAFLFSLIFTAHALPQAPSGVMTADNPCIVTPKMSDCQAVTMIWRKLTGKLSPFTDNSVCCGINGIFCTDDQLTVTSINWVGKSEILAKSTLPCQIAVLQKLKSIRFGATNIAYLPSNFGKLTSLRYFWAIGHQLKGLPASFGDLNKLEVMELTKGPLASLPSSFSKLSKLKWLLLSENQFKSFPSQIGDLSNLESIAFENNQLTSLPNKFGKLQKLTSLKLQNNQISSLPASIFDLTTLESV